MKATDSFKAVVKEHLEKRAQEDTEFLKSYQREGKNIDDCITYILNTVKNSGCNGFADSEIFGMAVHYYDEEKINVGPSVNGKVIVNHHVELSDEEKAAAKERARVKYEEAQLAELKRAEEKKEAREKKKEERLKQAEAKRSQEAKEAQERFAKSQLTIF